jgi:hypothetical protein
MCSFTWVRVRKKKKEKGGNICNNPSPPSIVKILDDNINFIPNLKS